MKIPVIKKKNNSYIKLPEELSNLENLELFELKKGFYILSGKNLDSFEDSSQEQNKEVRSEKKEITTQDGLSFVDRLLSIPFAQRTPKYIKKITDKREKEILKFLLEKKHIWIFTSKKYPGGVYNISDKLFSMWKDKRPTTQEKTDGKISELQKEGYMIISDQYLANKFSYQMKDSRKKILGLKGWNGKYYVATRKYYSKAKEGIVKKLKDSMSLERISQECNIPIDGCEVVLKLMAEEGEAIEKRKGVFALV